MKIRLFLSIFLLVSAGISFAETTRMDNEFWAFKPRAIFAVNNGAWEKPKYQLTIGLNGTSFNVDARGALRAVPVDCQKIFKLNTRDNKPIQTPKQGQFISIENHPSCVVKIWLNGPRWYPGGSFGSATIPDTSSVVTGIIEFHEKNSPAARIKFAVGADDTPFIGYSESLETKVDDTLLNDWIADIKAGERDCKTPKGCRDFVVTCIRPDEISRADKLNGVTEELLIGMSFIGFSKYKSKYVDKKRLARFKRTNKLWERVYTYNVPNIENCTYF